MLTEKEFNIKKSVFVSDLKIISDDLNMLVKSLDKGLVYAKYLEAIQKLNSIKRKIDDLL
ncbi:MAG: hypothetical protein KatS3mg002_0021 [Candidatus Woesearchaeota archaeon]|nr:MAG: hypothetical protein KatS3mg002_0021 [Candidatus Woesearchaeota archaeon]